MQISCVFTKITIEIQFLLPFLQYYKQNTFNNYIYLIIKVLQQREDKYENFFS